jgi:cytochrome c
VFAHISGGNSMTALAAIILVAAVSAVGIGTAHAAGDVVHGAVLYQRCQQCHSIQDNHAGPRHKGVFGRVAGTQPGYAYSDALRKSGIVWNEDTLDKWLTNPPGLVPGVYMLFHLPNPKDRADVIEFLKEKAK